MPPEDMELRNLPLNIIHPNLRQPRQDFDQESIASLARSVKIETLVQPIIVRPHSSIPGHYEIIAGERRFRAYRYNQRDHIPCIIKRGDLNTFRLSFVENFNREDLNDIEEALGYRRLIDEERMTLREIAELVNRTELTISLKLKLLELPEEIQEEIRRGKLKQGQALNLAQYKGSQGKLLRIARDLLLGKPSALLAIERLGSPEHGDKMVEARLPHSPEGLVRRILQVRARTRSTSPAINRFLTLPRKEQEAAWFVVDINLRKAVIAHLERLIEHIPLILKQLKSFEVSKSVTAPPSVKVLDKSRSFEPTAGKIAAIVVRKAPPERIKIDLPVSNEPKEPVVARKAVPEPVTIDLPRVTEPLLDVRTLRKILGALLYHDDEEKRVNLSQSRLCGLALDWGIEKTPEEIAEFTFGMLKLQWGRTPDRRDQHMDRFRVFAARIRRDFGYPSFDGFMREIRTLDKSRDPLWAANQERLLTVVKK